MGTITPYHWRDAREGISVVYRTLWNGIYQVEDRASLAAPPRLYITLGTISKRGFDMPSSAYLELRLADDAANAGVRLNLRYQERAENNGASGLQFVIAHGIFASSFAR